MNYFLLHRLVHKELSKTKDSLAKENSQLKDENSKLNEEVFRLKRQFQLLEHQSPHGYSANLPPLDRIHSIGAANKPQGKAIIIIIIYSGTSE